MSEMRNLIESVPEQIGAMVSVLKNADSTNHKNLAKGFTPSGVLILGMGGSGIGGSIMASILENSCTTPVMSVSNYTVPAWVNSSTLVVACSYSGNTEETISSISVASDKGAKISCISSGGKLSELAKSHNWPIVTLKGGHPPRSQFVSSFTCLAWTLLQFDIISHEMYSELAGTNVSIENSKERISVKAEALADLLEGKEVFIYSGVMMSSVATRWRQQLNENSKLLVNTHVFPEMNHNELVGWTYSEGLRVVLVLRTPEDHKRTQIRMELSAEIFQESGSDVIFIEPEGDNKMQRLMDLVYLGDYLSLIMAERAGIDPVEIHNITRLKDALDKV